MKKANITFPTLFISMIILAIAQSCTHDTFMDMDIDPEVMDTTTVNECITEDISYATFVSDVVATHCNGCHGTSGAQGGVTTATYEGLKTVALNGRLYGAIERLPGYNFMPLGSAKLDQCIIDKVKSWIDDGAPNN